MHICITALSSLDSNCNHYNEHLLFPFLMWCDVLYVMTKSIVQAREWYGGCKI